MTEHHSDRLGIVSLHDSATAEASHATRQEQACTAAEAETQAEIKHQLVALLDAHISASLSELSAHEGVPHSVRRQEQTCTPAGSSRGQGSASVVGHTSLAAPTYSARQDAMPHAQSQALVAGPAAAGTAALWVAACIDSFEYWTSVMLPNLLSVLWLKAPLLLIYSKPLFHANECASEHLQYLYAMP